MHMTAFAAATVLCALPLSPAFSAAQTYVVDTSHTFTRFEYEHLGFSRQVNRFDNTSGTVMYDAGARSASVDILINLKSVSTGSELFNEHIQGEDYLDTARFPEARYKSTAVHFDGDVPVRIDGELTLKGITRPVTLTVTAFKSGTHPMLNRAAIGANAHALIKRSDFDAGKYAPVVGDELTLSFSLEAIAH